MDKLMIVLINLVCLDLCLGFVNRRKHYKNTALAVISVIIGTSLSIMWGIVALEQNGTKTIGSIVIMIIYYILVVYRFNAFWNEKTGCRKKTK